MLILHTADWQIGMRAAQAGAKGDVVREARIESAERVIRLANERGVSLVLLAGDTFEDNAVDAIVVRRIVDLLLRSAAPVFVLPGNHDPLVPGSVFSHPAWREAEPRVRVIRGDEPIEVAGTVLLPVPCRAKSSSVDPTERIPARGGDTRIRIGIAHGSLREHGFPVKGDDYPIDPLSAERAGVNYLALGHWHSTLVEPSPSTARLAYSGTHEPTSFGERDSGNVLIVTLSRADAPAEVEVVPVGKLKWMDRKGRFSTDEDVSRLRAEIDAIDRPSETLLRMTLDGVLGTTGFECLAELETAAAARFLFARFDRAGLSPRPDAPDAWLAAVPDGIARTVAARLLHKAANSPEPTTRDVALHALTRLVTVARQVSA